MRELSLFSGVGGGLLGTLLLGWMPVGYVEFNDYRQRVIAQRIKDKILPNAPIFGDIRAFIDQGYAASYTGLVDVVTAGFPCQPFSTSGKRLGKRDKRNMWPATIECINVVRPKYALLENVPGLLFSGYFGTILGDLAESGYDARWRILSSAEMGAPHRRDRVWIVAYNEERLLKNKLSYTEGIKKAPGDGHWNEFMRLGVAELVQSWKRDFANLDVGVANRVEQLAAIGDGQDPRVVAAVWKLLTGE